MKVILLEDLKNLGEKYEVVEVSDGYARNFLLKKGKAKIASKSALAKIEKMKEKEKKEKEEKIKEIKKLISDLEKKKITIKTKTGEKDQLFESITAKKISDKLQKEGFEINEDKIKLEEPIKDLGEKNILIKFEDDLKTNIKIKIESE